MTKAGSMTKPGEHPTVEERAAAGKVARAELLRARHAGWSAAQRMMAHSAKSRSTPPEAG